MADIDISGNATYAVQLVAGKFSSAAEIADDALQGAGNYMAALEALLESLEVPDDINVEEVVFPEITPVDFYSRPNFTSQLESFPTFDDPLPSAPTLVKVPVSDLSSPGIVELTDPGAMVYTPNAYNSEIQADLFAKILNDLRNGGTGLTPAVEADIYDRGRERQRVENERLYQETESRFGATGFGLPGGALASSLQGVGEEISRKNDQMNREITINQAELEQKNTHFIMDLAFKAESILLDFYNNQENRLFEAAKAIAQSTIDIYNAITTNQSLKLERYKTEADVFKVLVESTLKENEVLIQQYDTQVKAFVSQMDLEIKNAQLQVEAFKTEAAVFEVETKATSMYYDVALKESELQVQAFTAKISQQIAILEANTGGYVALKSLQEKGVEGIMNVNAQLAASALNAVNASASLSQSSSTSTTSEV